MPCRVFVRSYELRSVADGQPSRTRKAVSPVAIVTLSRASSSWLAKRARPHTISPCAVREAAPVASLLSDRQKKSYGVGLDGARELARKCIFFNGLKKWKWHKRDMALDMPLDMGLDRSLPALCAPLCGRARCIVHYGRSRSGEKKEADGFPSAFKSTLVRSCCQSLWTASRRATRSAIHSRISR